VQRGLPPAALVRLLCGAPARRFGLAPGKGALTPGADADLVLLDPDATWAIDPAGLLDRHRLSPYAGRSVRGCVVRTLLRGETVAADGRLVGPPRGRVVRRGG
jgi:allantoinase